MFMKSGLHPLAPVTTAVDAMVDIIVIALKIWATVSRRQAAQALMVGFWILLRICYNFMHYASMPDIRFRFRRPFRNSFANRFTGAAWRQLLTSSYDASHVC